mmetsp:Transcript_30086/g.79752  ORF Transcript_30086/g.79752 Transcript_30086/m.79752 type:complete len:251 (+) Transcript_30086:645-1397(+)
MARRERQPPLRLRAAGLGRLREGRVEAGLREGREAWRVGPGALRGKREEPRRRAHAAGPDPSGRPRRQGRPRQQGLQDAQSHRALDLRGRREGRWPLDRDRAQDGGGRRHHRRPERREVLADLRRDEQGGENRRVPLHDHRAERWLLQGRRARRPHARRRAGPHRRRERGPRHGRQVPAAHRALPHPDARDLGVLRGPAPRLRLHPARAAPVQHLGRVEAPGHRRQQVRHPRGTRAPPGAPEGAPEARRP